MSLPANSISAAGRLRTSTSSRADPTTTCCSSWRPSRSWCCWPCTAPGRAARGGRWGSAPSWPNPWASTPSATGCGAFVLGCGHGRPDGRVLRPLLKATSCRTPTGRIRRSQSRCTRSSAESGSPIIGPLVGAALADHPPGGAARRPATSSPSSPAPSSSSSSSSCRRASWARSSALPVRRRAPRVRPVARPPPATPPPRSASPDRRETHDRHPRDRQASPSASAA